ncbi:MAG TPA: DUF4157 domain-containing protein, partial [Blastocatellia bacterium]|nr:DUF4157 domain-containing protein [Blastocatellia bacterium]
RSHPFHALQRSAGNQAVARMLREKVLQAKLRVSQPTDASEIEADRVAEQVTRSSDPCVSSPKGIDHSRRDSVGIGHTAHPAASGSAQPIQRAATRATSEQTGFRSLRNLAGAGRPLDSLLREQMESRFDEDFSHVRLHYDREAAKSAEQVNARAYTVGRNIVFGAGQYSPETHDGRKLLAHELTHVVQQSGGVARSAQQNVKEGTANQSLVQMRNTQPLIQRDPDDKHRSSHSRKIVPPAEPVPEEDRTADQFDLLMEISAEFHGSFEGAEAAKRGNKLERMFKALEPDSARRVEEVITSGKLKDSFLKIPVGVRKKLSAILADKKGGVIKRRPGIYGVSGPKEGPWRYYIVRQGVTINEIAHYLSDDPDLASVIESKNNLPRDKSLDAGTLVYFPKSVALGAQARRHLNEDVANGTLLQPVGSFRPKHEGTRDMIWDDIPLTRSEFENIKEQQIQAQHGVEAVETIASQTIESQKTEQRDKEQKRAQQTPSSILTLIFPTSALYVKDQSSLIHDPFLRLQYQTTQEGFYAGTNVYRVGGAVGAGIEASGVALLEIAPVIPELVGSEGLRESALYGARYIYLNAPALYGKAALAVGASLSTVALYHHAQQVRSQGLHPSDFIQFLEDLTPLASGYSEYSQTNVGGSSGTRTSGSGVSTPRTPGPVQRFLLNNLLTSALKGADIAEISPGIGAGGSNVRGPAVTLVEPGGTPAPTTGSFATVRGAGPTTPAPAGSTLVERGPTVPVAPARTVTSTPSPTNVSLVAPAPTGTVVPSVPFDVRPTRTEITVINVGEDQRAATQLAKVSALASTATSAIVASGVASAQQRTAKQKSAASKSSKQKVTSPTLNRREQLRANLDARVEDLKKRIAELTIEKGRVQRELKAVNESLNTLQKGGNETEKNRLQAEREKLKTYQQEEVGSEKGLGLELAEARRVRSGTEADYFDALSSAASKRRVYTNVRDIKTDEVFHSSEGNFEVEHVYPRSKIFTKSGFERLTWEQQIGIFNYRPNLKCMPKRANNLRKNTPYKSLPKEVWSLFTSDESIVRNMAALEDQMDKDIDRMIKDPSLIPRSEE